MECTVAASLPTMSRRTALDLRFQTTETRKVITLDKSRVLSGLSRSMGVGSTRPGGLEPPTSGFGDLRSTN